VGLQQALASRSVIDQLGIVMSGHKLDADEAFGILRRSARGRQGAERSGGCDPHRQVSL
jgi:AmiR/NasT family two-component response regulator